MTAPTPEVWYCDEHGEARCTRQEHANPSKHAGHLIEQCAPDCVHPSDAVPVVAHEHFYGWSERNGAEKFTHEHERGGEPHEHVLRDGGTEVKRTTWTIS